jgi:ATP-binding cassette subfamily C protein CydC
LTINKGQITALVGPSGSGKTSLLNILMRFWDYSAGEILVEGDDLREFTPISTRKLFGVISQSSYFFAETIRQNLLLANENASDEQLIEAIKKAELAQWFAALPEGLDTWLGEQGMRMSGGEAQRLAIARVLLQETPFILLDEPTSHLDPDTEKNVLATLFKLFSDSGVLLITHHLVMLDQVNEIVYLSDGKVVERGEQAELIKKEGYFYRYWQLQQNSLLADQA